MIPIVVASVTAAVQVLLVMTEDAVVVAAGGLVRLGSATLEESVRVIFTNPCNDNYLYSMDITDPLNAYVYFLRLIQLFFRT